MCFLIKTIYPNDLNIQDLKLNLQVQVKTNPNKGSYYCAISTGLITIYGAYPAIYYQGNMGNVAFAVILF